MSWFSGPSAVLLLALIAAQGNVGNGALHDNSVDAAPLLSAQGLPSRRRRLQAEPAAAAAAAALPLDPFGRFESKGEAVAALTHVLSITGSSGGLQVAYYDVPDAAMRKLWKAWKARYKRDKVYQGRPAADAVAFRYFTLNVERIVDSLQDVTKPNWFMLGARMDRSPGPPNGGALPPTDLDYVDAGPARPSVIKEWDWRALGKVTDAKDQEDCAGCWAFVGVAAIESKVLISTGANHSATPLDLSEQQVLDCASAAAGFESKGCEGGYLWDAFIFASRGLGFVTTEQRYPFVAASAACDTARLQNVDGASKVQLAEEAFGLLRPWSAAALREAVLVQPVAVSIFAPDLYQFYSGGLWTANQCQYPAGPPTASKAVMNHAVLVVGFNMTARPPYWIVKNSWGSGTSWGDDGFGLVEMTGLDGKDTWGTCFMYTWMLKPAEVLPKEGDPETPAPQTRTVRLMPGNSKQRYGRLEMLRDGRWGTVCARDFDSVDATVACRQLQLGTSGVALEGPRYGQGRGLPIHAAYVECTGEEAALEQCTYSRGAVAAACSHAEDVSIECGDALPQVTVRLANSGGDLSSGRLEVYNQGVWGTVCDDGISDAAAAVVCRQLGLGSSGSAIQRAPFGPGAGPIWLSRVACTGQEYKLESCPNAGWGRAAGCTHAEDVGIRCYGETGEADTLPGVVTARLVGGSSSRQGRLEIFRKGAWGSVCDDGADAGLAQVLCKQLGFPPPAGASSSRVVGGAYFGQGTGPPPIYIHCTGKEASWEKCGLGGLGARTCAHSEDVGVACGVALDAMVRLAGGPDARSGRLEVRRNGAWGTVCNRGFDPIDARTVCRSLGLGVFGALAAFSPAASGSPIHMADLFCEGSEATLLECQSRPAAGCTHAMDVGIRCGDAAPTGGTLRLVNGPNSTAGRLEIQMGGTWGTICDTFATDQLATVACRQLGLGSLGQVAPVPKPFGEGTGPIHMAGVECTGAESRVEECPRWPSTASCRHYEDLGIVCADPPLPFYRFAAKWGTGGTGAGQLQGPNYVATARNGDVLVSDNTHRVHRFSRQGVHIVTFGSAGSAPGQFSRPPALAQLEAPSTDLLIMSEGGQRVERYSLEGRYQGGWGMDVANPDAVPLGLAVRNGRVYVSDPSRDRVLVYSTAGAFIQQLAAGRDQGVPGLYKPGPLAIDPAGQTLFVLYPHNDVIAKYSTATGQPLGQLGAAQLFMSRSVCLAEDGNVIAGNKTNLLVFSQGGAYLGAFGGGQGEGDGQFRVLNSAACARDGSGAVFVSDGFTDRVQQFVKTAAARAAGVPAEVAGQLRQKTAGSGALVVVHADVAQQPSAQAAAGGVVFTQTAADAAAAAGATAGAAGTADGQQVAPPVSASLARMQASLARFVAAVVAGTLPPGQQGSASLAQRLVQLADSLEGLLLEVDKGSTT